MQNGRRISDHFGELSFCNFSDIVGAVTPFQKINFSEICLAFCDFLRSVSECSLSRHMLRVCSRGFGGLKMLSGDSALHSSVD